MSLRLVLISDTHGLHRELGPLPEGDVLIHAGDFMRTGKKIEEVEDFEAWFSSQPHEHKIYIAGNHDILMETGHPEMRRVAMKHWNISYLLDGAYCFYQGDLTRPLKFWGSPWTTRFLHWAFMSERGPEMKKHWDLIPADTDVLITHGPPQGVLDSLPAYGPDLGCEELRSAVLRIEPRLHIFGHIHSSYGQQQLGRTRCVNAAVLNDRYELQNPPVVVDL